MKGSYSSPPNDARECGGCFGAKAPSLDASRPSPCSADRVVPPLRGATRLRRVPGCRHRVEPATASLRAAEGGTSADPVEMALRYGPEMTVPD